LGSGVVATDPRRLDHNSHAFAFGKVPIIRPDFGELTVI
jgi:hypothetical protein